MISGDTKGFSVVELMIAAAVVATLLAIALPYYNAYERSTCDRVAEHDLTNLLPAWEKYCTDENNLLREPPRNLTDLAGSYYGWSGTTEACQVRITYDRESLTVYATALKGSHPRGAGTYYKYKLVLGRSASSGVARLDTIQPPRDIWSVLAGLLEPGPAYGMSSLKLSGSGNKSDSNTASKPNVKEPAPKEPPKVAGKPQEEDKASHKSEKQRQREIEKQKKKSEREKRKKQKELVKEQKKKQREIEKQKKAQKKKQQKEKKAKKTLKAVKVSAAEWSDSPEIAGPEPAPEMPAEQSDTPARPSNVGYVTQPELATWHASPFGDGCASSAFDPDTFEYCGCANN